MLCKMGFKHGKRQIKVKLSKVIKKARLKLNSPRMDGSNP